MIEPVFFFSPIWVMATAAVTMIVLRGGVSRLFFNLVGTFQASRLIHDAEAAATALNGLFLDALSGIFESATELNEQFREIENTIIPIAREIELANVELEKFFDTAVFTADKMDIMANSVREIGAEFGFAGEEALKAGGRAAQLQALYGAGAVEPLTKGGMALAFVGDMGATEAQQAMISLMQQNALVTGELTQAEFALLDAYEQRDVITASVANTLNSLNSVEDASAARMPEIIEAMNHFGGVARLAGEDIGFMAAMTATLIERGIRAETAGTALRFVYARVGGDINGAGQALRDLGIATHDANGNLRPMQKVLNELAPAFNKMNGEQQQALAQTMAGNRHYARLLLLMQDLSRANQLYGEVQENTGKVMEENGEAAGYLADLFANTAFQIEQTEARITNLQAAIGERLLPAQLEALQAQEDLLTAFDMLMEGMGDSPLGNFIADIYAARTLLQDVYMPFVTLHLNIFSAQIALSGFRQVMRAINGETIAYIKGQEGQLISIENREKLRLAKLDLQEKKMIAQSHRLELQGLVLRRNNHLTNMKIRNLGLEALRTESLVLMDEQRNLIAARHGTFKKKTKRELEIEKQLLGITKQIEKEKKVILADQSRLLTDINSKTKGVNQATGKVRAAMKRVRQASKEVNAELDAMKQKLIQNESAGDAMMHSISPAAAASMAFGMSTMVVSMAVMALGEKLNAIPFVHFADGAEVMAASMFIMALSFVPMIANIIITTGKLITLTSLKAYYAIQNYIVTTSNYFLAKSEGSYSVAALLALKALWAKIMAIPSYISGAIAAAGANLKLAATSGTAAASSYTLAGALTAVLFSLVGILVLTGVGIGLIMLAGAAVKAAKKWGILKTAVDDTNDALDGVEGSDYDYDTSGVDGYTDSINAAREAQEKFNNSREEMFFGFKAGNVQGALVKQIQQQGVETFIANTEVIQTNNFNGMTTREMANIVLDAIESEAGVRGINLSGVSV